MRILLVEDNAINHLLFKRLFDKLDIAVDLVENGEQACEAVQQQHYDIVFMDVFMPVMNGIEATIKIRETNIAQQPVIIAITAFSDEEEWEKCKQAGMNDSLGKPFTKETLEAIIQKWSTPQ